MISVDSDEITWRFTESMWVAANNTMHNAISHTDIKTVLSVRRAIRHYKPDVVYCHSSKAGAIGRIVDVGIKNCNGMRYLIL